MRKVPFLIAGAALFAAAAAPMASTPGPTPSPGAKPIQLPRDTQCRMLPFEFDLSKRAIVRVATSSGIYCANQFQPDGIVIKHFEVREQPKNGVLSLNQADKRWYYRPKDGFKGDDMFVLNVGGYDRIKWGQTQMFVYVSVQ